MSTDTQPNVLDTSSLIDDRPSWDEYFLRQAYDISSRGGCKRRRVGAILVDINNNPIGQGYNGRASGLPNCNSYRVLENGEREYPCACAGANSPSGTNLDSCEAIHAEWNALIRCRAPMEIHTCYVTTSCCTKCVDILLATTCRRIVFLEHYPHQDARSKWERAGREWIHHPLSL